MENSIRVLLVEDHPLVRRGLRHEIEENSNRMRVIAEADTIDRGLNEVRLKKPDVVILDIRMPDGNGLDACRLIKEILPSIRVIILSAYVNDDLVAQALAAGVDGYLLKNSDQNFVEAISNVMDGKAVLNPVAARKLISLLSRKEGAPDASKVVVLPSTLSQQEARVAELVATGKTNKEIAVGLKLGEKTVRNYLGNIFCKLGISRRSELAVWFVRSKGVK